MKGEITTDALARMLGSEATGGVLPDMVGRFDSIPDEEGIDLIVEAVAEHFRMEGLDPEQTIGTMDIMMPWGQEHIEVENLDDVREALRKAFVEHSHDNCQECRRRHLCSYYSIGDKAFLGRQHHTDEEIADVLRNAGKAVLSPQSRWFSFLAAPQGEAIRWAADAATMGAIEDFGVDMDVEQAWKLYEHMRMYLAVAWSLGLAAARKFQEDIPDVHD